MINRQISIGLHKARQLCITDIVSADLIIVFEEVHRRYIFDTAPEHLHKVFLLSELARESGEIADPHGKPIEAYAYALRQFDYYIERGWEFLIEQLLSAPVDITKDQQ